MGQEITNGQQINTGSEKERLEADDALSELKFEMEARDYLREVVRQLAPSEEELFKAMKRARLERNRATGRRDIIAGAPLSPIEAIKREQTELVPRLIGFIV